MGPPCSSHGCLSKRKLEVCCTLNQSIELPLVAKGFILNAFSFSVQIAFISRTFNGNRFAVPTASKQIAQMI